MFISDREGNRVPQKCVAVNPVLARTQFLYSNANDSDDYVFVEPGNYYTFTSTGGGFKLGLADVTVDSNVMWVAQPGKSIFIHIPANEEYLHFDGLIPGSRGYLRKLTGKEDETSINMWNQLFPNLVAYYRMDDNAENKIVVDSMGYSDGTAQRNTNLFSTTGKIDKALNFNGTSDYINTGKSFNPVFTGSFTISAWVYATQSTKNKWVFGVQDVSAVNFVDLVWTSGNKVVFQYGMFNGRAILTTPTSLSPSTWYHIVGVVEQTSILGFTIYLYINNILITTGFVNALMSEFVCFLYPFIGQHNKDGDPGVNEYFKGLVDDIMIFNRVLTLEEIEFLYERGGK